MKLRICVIRCDLCVQFIDHLCKRPDIRGVGFSSTGRHLDQARCTSQVCMPRVDLKLMRRPALRVEPLLQERKAALGGVRSAICRAAFGHA